MEIDKKKFLNNKRKRKESLSNEEGNIREKENNLSRTKSTAISESENGRFRKPRVIIEDHSEEEDEEEEVEEEINPEEELKNKIKDLLFFKVELPSTSSVKSIITALDDINKLIENVPRENLQNVKNKINILFS